MLVTSNIAYQPTVATYRRFLELLRGRFDSLPCPACRQSWGVV